MFPQDELFNQLGEMKTTSLDLKGFKIKTVELINYTTAISLVLYLLLEDKY